MNILETISYFNYLKLKNHIKQDGLYFSSPSPQERKRYLIPEVYATLGAVVAFLIPKGICKKKQITNSYFFFFLPCIGH